MYESKTFQSNTVGKAGKEGIGEVAANAEEVEPTNEVSIHKCLVIPGQDAHHLDEGGKFGEAGTIPQKLNRALAPRTGNQEGMVEITR